ncbi:ABC transporter [Candidatus Saccharibacteria bacterium]|nr:ABC transporter [Candidatus Saccharibacteria bacterium]|tara:strand:+ start:1352 stop:3121 length:1770 start_codon:yes stop_codon:yes gene_type:complete
MTKRKTSKATAAATLRLYWQQVKKHKASFIVAIICVPLSSLAINALLSYFFSQTIAQLLTDNQTAVWQNLTLAAITGFLGFALNLIGFSTLVYHEAKITKLLRNNVFETLINKDLQFFVNEKIGSLTSKYIDFVRSHVVVQDLLIIRTLGLVLSLSVGLTIIALQSLLLAGVLIALLIAIVLEVRWSIRHREEYRTARRELRSEIHATVADNLTNSLVVKTFSGEKREIRKVHQLTGRFETVYRRDIGFIAREGSFRILLLVIMQLVAIATSAWLATTGQIDVATVIFSLTYLQLVGSQLFMVGELLNGYEEALLEASPMTEILVQASLVTDDDNAARMTVKKPVIEFKKVSFSYGDSAEKVIDSLNLNIPAGQKVGLVGHSGAGKTTLTHLLLRFSDVTGGQLLIDGQDVRHVTQQSLRGAIAYVPQEPLLFHRSLRENIAYGKPEASIDEIKEAARKANALEFIDKLPHGLETLVGERGIKLSGGQRQRIAIARAILKDAPILVLDEATSALDSESEQLIQAALKTLMSGRTSIVIAHRLSTISQLDRIIVLDGGKVVEDGSHQELLSQKGIYARLWSHQSGGFIEE